MIGADDPSIEIFSVMQPLRRLAHLYSVKRFTIPFTQEAPI